MARQPPQQPARDHGRCHARVILAREDVRAQIQPWVAARSRRARESLGVGHHVDIGVVTRVAGAGCRGARPSNWPAPRGTRAARSRCAPAKALAGEQQAAVEPQRGAARHVAVEHGGRGRQHVGPKQAAARMSGQHLVRHVGAHEHHRITPQGIAAVGRGAGSRRSRGSAPVRRREHVHLGVLQDVRPGSRRGGAGATGRGHAQGGRHEETRQEQAPRSSRKGPPWYPWALLDRLRTVTSIA
jgi:hypothetical protein